MFARRPLWRALFLLASMLIAAAAMSAVAADDKSDPEPAGDGSVTPAIDPAKVADNVFLKIQDNRNRAQSSNNLKQIILAVHIYYDANGFLPGDILDKDGKPLLSWRVQLLPYVEQGELYKKFKLDEAWDSKNNRPLVEQMPKIFASPRAKVKGTGYTVYQIFTGPAALFDKGKPRYKLPAIPDGTSQTLFAVESSKAVPWSKPADVSFDKDKKVPDIGKAYGEKPLGAMMDGSTRILDLKKIKPETLKNAIMPDDGNVLGPDWKE
jgi:hypothetical protein